MKIELQSESPSLDEKSKPLAPQSTVQARTFSAYLSSNAFQCIGLALAAATGLSYAVGRAYLDNWNAIAGVPSLLFPVEFHDVILLGLRLESVWRIPAFAITAAALYIWIVDRLPHWVSSWRWVRQLAKCHKDGWDQLGLRNRFAQEAYAVRSKRLPGGHTRAQLRWKILGCRGQLRSMHQHSRQQKRGRPVSASTIRCLLVIVVMLFLTGTYLLCAGLFLLPASSAGAKDFVSIYVAVTGHVPPQYNRTQVNQKQLKSWACHGLDQLSDFRSITIHPDSSSNPSALYLIQGANNTYLLLGTSGTRIAIFGDKSVQLIESDVRDVSTITLDCKKS